MQNSFRVTIVTRSLMMGGTQRHIVKLCQELAREDIEISLCLLINDEPNDLISEIPSSVRVHTFPHRRHDLRTVFWLAGVLRAERSHLLHSFLWHADFYSSLLKILVPGLVVIASERGDRSTRSFYKPAYNRIDRLLVFPLVNGVCANSHFGKRVLIAGGCNPKKISVIPNGINLAAMDAQPVADVRKILGWPDSTIVGCIVSRLVDYKGLDGFIDLVKFCDQGIRFAIIGDGPEKQSLSQLVKTLSLNDRVALMGQINPAMPYIKGADICILPNKDSEHCSNSILEYMACGKPVLAMDVGGNSELVQSGMNGLLIDPADTQSLPAALNSLVANHELARQMGLAGRQRVEERFQMKEVASRFHSLWKKYLENKV